MWIYVYYISCENSDMKYFQTIVSTCWALLFSCQICFAARYGAGGDEFMGPAGFAVAQSNAAFTNDLYSALASVQNENFVFSPLSLSSVLAMLLAGADGKTADEIHRSLRFAGLNDSAVFSGYSELLFSLHENKDTILESANRLYATDRVNIRQRFLQVIRENFYAVAKPLNFVQNYDAADEINDWVSSTTHGKIDNVISPDLLSRRTVAILVNAIYFRGKWQYEFDSKDTKPGSFITEGGRRVPVQMMEQEDEFFFSEISEMRSSALAIPFRGNRFIFVIVLPNEDVRLSDVESRMAHYNILLSDIPSKLEPKFVRLSLPKFRIESETDFVESGILQKLGMKTMINPGVANFNGISSEIDIHIDSVIQKAYIEVNEGGTEAAAATYAKAVPLSIRYSTPFIVDRPFLVFIYDKISTAVLFVARKTA